MDTTGIIIAVAAAFFSSLVIVAIMAFSLKTARRNNSAVSYVVENSFEVTAARDRFLYTERHEEKISDDDD